MNLAKKKNKVLDSESLSNLIVEAIQEKKAKSIRKLDLRNLQEAVADYFIICHGTSTTQVGAIGNFLDQHIKDEIGEIPLHREGISNSEWVLIDYFNVVVHIFLKEKREFYDLEGLWEDAVVTEFEDF